MGNRWTINSDLPNKLEAYDWRAPDLDQEHVLETVAPGDLNLRPSEIELIPTNAPDTSGVQGGQNAWTSLNVPDSDWYVIGQIIQEDED